MPAIRLLAINATNPAANVVSRAIDTLGMKDVSIILKSPTSTSAGTVQLEGSATGSLGADPSTADWAPIGAALPFGVANTTVAVSAVAAYRFVRARVTVSFVGGASNATVYVVLCGSSSGAWQDV